MRRRTTTCSRRVPQDVCNTCAGMCDVCNMWTTCSRRAVVRGECRSGAKCMATMCSWRHCRIAPACRWRHRSASHQRLSWSNQLHRHASVALPLRFRYASVTLPLRSRYASVTESRGRRSMPSAPSSRQFFGRLASHCSLLSPPRWRWSGSKPSTTICAPAPR